MSLIAARIRLILTDRAGLKLNDLLVSLEKMLDDFESMRYTKACTRTNKATFISVCPKSLSIIIIVLVDNEIFGLGEAKVLIEYVFV
nr:hypothetical protein CFP56_40047 [Quercus suber]